MSTLTKVLIVLLALSTFALCALVATYVTNAENFKEKYTNERNAKQAAVESEKKADKERNETIAKSRQQEDRLKNEISSLNIKLREVENKLKDAEREKALLDQKVNNWAAVVEGWTKTKEKQAQLLEKTLGEKNELDTEKIQLEKELEETSATLLAKMAIIEALEKDKRLFLEEKTQLQKKLDEFLRPLGREAGAPVTVTRVREPAMPAKLVVRDIALEGVVTGVDLKNSLASVSLGKADGVKGGTKFYVTRADEFICEILITDVDTEQAVGVLERVQKQPRPGDNVSTNL